MVYPAKLTLYYYPSCFYCQRVLSVIEQLQVDVELHDILIESESRRELIAARGRSTVPVLRIFSEQGETWMPESRDIVAYLEKNFAKF
ncbi:MAG: glutathione S-transferase N-terminal domain-containing protein [Myxococcales bacterium]|nr:MAG: glutathione S-transferase N-terminal domain-containing protein [Myxococcales bacterium]